jgi:predicted SnoaL-like aldol condensation-catalyzing enzyme
MFRTATATLSSLIATLLIACSGSGAPDHAAKELTESNRAIVADFVDLMYRQKDARAAFMKHVAADYVQHNPNIADGRDAAIAALAPMFSRPQAAFDVKRVLVDGDLAAVHLHGRPSPDDPGGAVVDLFRLENGKIVEHWDVLQPMPETSVNPHPMF